MDKYIYLIKDKKRTHAKINKLISGQALCWYIFKNEETRIEVYYYNNKNDILKRELLSSHIVTEDVLSETQISQDTYVRVEDKTYEDICYIKIEDVIEYIRIINILSESTEYVFRGQKNKNWRLTASIFRKNYSDHKESKIYREIRQNRFDGFDNKSFLDNLIHMQHYEIPTRLLDWSKNPLIPLFFSCAENKNDEDGTFNDGRVFIYKPIMVHGFDSEVYKEISIYLENDFNILSLTEKSEELLVDIVRKSLPQCIFIESTYENQRLKAQRGLFSIYIDIKDCYIDIIKKRLIGKTKLGRSLSERAVINIMRYSIGEGVDIKTFLNPIILCEPNLNNYTDSDMENFIVELKEMNYWNIGNDKNYETSISSEVIDFIIPANSKEKMLLQLEKLNINSLTVYPDFNGFVQYVKDKYER